MSPPWPRPKPPPEIDSLSPAEHRQAARSSSPKNHLESQAVPRSSQSSRDEPAGLEVRLWARGLGIGYLSQPRRGWRVVPVSAIFPNNAEGAPRSRRSFQTKLRVPPVPRLWGPGRENRTACSRSPHPSLSRDPTDRRVPGHRGTLWVGVWVGVGVIRGVARRWLASHKAQSPHSQGANRKPCGRHRQGLRPLDHKIVGRTSGAAGKHWNTRHTSTCGDYFESLSDSNIDVLPGCLNALIVVAGLGRRLGCFHTYCLSSYLLQ